METVRQTRKNGHKDNQKKKEKKFKATIRQTRKNGNKDTKKKEDGNTKAKNEKRT